MATEIDTQECEIRVEVLVEPKAGTATDQKVGQVFFVAVMTQPPTKEWIARSPVAEAAASEYSAFAPTRQTREALQTLRQKLQGEGWVYAGNWGEGAEHEIKFRRSV